MDWTWIFIVGAIALAAQMLLCFFCKRLWLRLLPCCVCFVASVGSFALYYAQNNWAWLIIMLFPLYALAMTGIAWLLYGAVRIGLKCFVCKEKILDNEDSV